MSEPLTNIISRNLLRLLRAGAFGMQEPVEPLSAWKWQRLADLARAHGVDGYVAQGIGRCGSQFFVQQMPPELLEQWRSKALTIATPDNDDGDEGNEFLEPFKLTNPLLNRRLQAILDDEQSDLTTRQMLVMLLRVARYLLNRGLPLKHLVSLGLLIRRSGSKCNNDLLQQWIKELRLTRVAHLAAALLQQLFLFQPEELAFAGTEKAEDIAPFLSELPAPRSASMLEWQFRQDNTVFVHTSNTSALWGQVRRSMKNMRYYPAESPTNFFASFAHSLSHIEE